LGAALQPARSHAGRIANAARLGLVAWSGQEGAGWRWGAAMAFVREVAPCCAQASVRSGGPCSLDGRGRVMEFASRENSAAPARRSGPYWCSAPDPGDNTFLVGGCRSELFGRTMWSSVARQSWMCPQLSGQSWFPVSCTRRTFQTLSADVENSCQKILKPNRFSRLTCRSGIVSSN
jgi:hypothetical protein